VALEATGPALRIKRRLEPHVGRVVTGNTRKLRAIAEAKVETYKVDALTLCELLAAGFLPEVFGPDEGTRALRRRLARRAALVRQRTRSKNVLRHRLLPQPGGFEGLLVIVICLYTYDQSVTKGGDEPDRYVEAGLAPLAAARRRRGD
jgi:transposase